MPPETTIGIRLRVNDDGSVVLDKFSGKLSKIPGQIDSMNRSMSLIKWDSITNLGEKIYRYTSYVYNFGKSIASAANDIERQAGIVGMSTDQWQKWTYAARMSDVSTEALMMSFKFLSQNMIESRKEGSEANQAFRALGLTGKTVDEVFLQLADRFSKTGDSEGKIAYATKLAGRSAMEVIPMWDRGSKALKELGDTAAKTGKILSEDLVKQGSKAEDQFKNWEASWDAFKKRALIPHLETLGKILDTLTKMSDKMEEYGRRMKEAMPEPQAGTMPSPGRASVEPRGGVYDSSKWIREWVEKYKPGKLPPIIDPAAIEKEMKEGLQRADRLRKSFLENWYEGQEAPEGFEWTKQLDEQGRKNIDRLERRRGATGIGGVPFDDQFLDSIIAQTEELYTKWQLIPNSETLAKWGREFSDTIEEIDSDFGKTKIADPSALGIPAEGYVVIGGQMFKIDDLVEYKNLEEELRQQRLSADSEDNWQYWERVTPGMGPTTEYQEAMKKVTEEEKKAKEWGDRINDGLNIMASSVSALEGGWKSFFATMASGFAKLIQDIMMATAKAQLMAALPTSLGGGGKGFFGLFGGGGASSATSAAGGIPAWDAGGAFYFANGGIVTKPTLGVVGESGPEAVIPLDRMKSKGSGQSITIGTYIAKVEATDVKSFERKYGGSVGKMSTERKRKQVSWRQSS